MHWYMWVAYFLGGAFLVNAVPHFTNGVSGRAFPTPFASPPGKGQSSATVNVLWGTPMSQQDTCWSATSGSSISATSPMCLSREPGAC